MEGGSGSETVKVIREEHEGRWLAIIWGGIPGEVETEGVMSDGGYELIDDRLFSDREHDLTFVHRSRVREAAAQC